MRIAILAADGVERIELEEPRGALYGPGALSDVLSLHGGEIHTDGHILDPDSHMAELPDLMMCVPARTTTLAR